MTHFEYMEKLAFLKHLATLRRTGTPLELSDKLNLSVRTVLRMIQQLKEHGCPISFNRFRNTYEIKDE